MALTIRCTTPPQTKVESGVNTLDEDARSLSATLYAAWPRPIKRLNNKADFDY
jgi:hypothetical protein